MRLILTITTLFFLLAAADGYDTALLREGHPYLGTIFGSGVWMEWMRRSVFEGDGLGVGDLPILIQIACALGYGWSLRRSADPRLRAWRPALALLVVAALVTAGWVHLTKGLVARPRPYVVRSGLAVFHPFFDLTVPDLFAFGKGSFPSGHTATMMTLWTGVYVLAWRRAGRLPLAVYGIFCLVGAGLMAYSRVALGDHWPTDTMASMIVTGLLGQLMARHFLARPWALGPSPDPDHTASIVRRDVQYLGRWVIYLVLYGAILCALRLIASGNPWTGAILGLMALGGCYGMVRSRTAR